MELWCSALLCSQGLWEMWDSAPSQHSKRCPWLRGLSAVCGDVFPERAFSLCLGSCCCCCGVLLVAGVGGKAAVPEPSWWLWDGCCRQQSHFALLAAQSLPNLASDTSRDCARAWLRSPGGLRGFPGPCPPRFVFPRIWACFPFSLCLWSTHSWCSGRWPEASEGLQAAGWVCEGI